MLNFIQKWERIVINVIILFVVIWAWLKMVP